MLWTGSVTHEQDFYACIDALDGFFLEHKDEDVRLLIMGYLPNCIRAKTADTHWQNRIEFVEFRKIETYFSILRTVMADIGIAPLLVNSFNETKSNIKWIEYTIAGVPTVASRVAPYERDIENGKTGFLVSNPGEWRDVLEEKFHDRENKKWQKIVDNSRLIIEQKYNIGKVKDQWNQVFRKL